jgi:exonuclease VII small subunit
MDWHELGTQNWDCNSKNDFEDYEIEREELETILEKLKNGKAPGEEYSELHK